MCKVTKLSAIVPYYSTGIFAHGAGIFAHGAGIFAPMPMEWHFLVMYPTWKICLHLAASGAFPQQLWGKSNQPVEKNNVIYAIL